MNNKLITLIITISLSVSALGSEILAPFGFNWGDTREQLISKGIKLDCGNEADRLSICRTERAVVDVSFAKSYSLVFDDKIGLIKVQMAGNDIESDITGSKGKELYSRVANSISEKYGVPSSYEYSGREVYREYDEFYQCLKYDGCGNWVSYWGESNSLGFITLQLIGSSRGTGYLRILYESTAFYQIVDEIKNEEATNDSNAF